MTKKKLIVFLDANIIFSAAYKEKNDIVNLWKTKNLNLITSYYALEEAKRNLDSTAQIQRLNDLMNKVNIYNEVSTKLLPITIKLRDKDRPILAAAIAAKANYLITGDIKDFGKYFGQFVLGVKILPLALFFEEIME